MVNHWYITAYEPIRDLAGGIIGMLYVGVLEQKYVDLRQRAVMVFLAITLVGALVAFALAYFISGRISVSIKKLASASEQVAHGNLDAQVEIRSHDELRELADTFNFMAAALKKRDEQLREFTTRRIMESERLAHIGQLAAGRGARDQQSPPGHRHLLASAAGTDRTRRTARGSPSRRSSSRPTAAATSFAACWISPASGNRTNACPA